MASEKEERDALAQLCRDLLSTSLSNEKMIQLIEEKMQPLKDKIQKLSDENRRMKISLSFFETELKEAGERTSAKKVVTKDAETQVDESNFLSEIEPEDKTTTATTTSGKIRMDKQVNGHVDMSLKRMLANEREAYNSKAKRQALDASAGSSSGKQDYTATIAVPPRTTETRTTARKSTGSFVNTTPAPKEPAKQAKLAPAPVPPVPQQHQQRATNTMFQLQTGTAGMGQTVNVNAGVLNGLQTGSYVLINQNGQLIASPAGAAGLLIRPATAATTPSTPVASNARPATRNTASATAASAIGAVQHPATTVANIDKNIWNHFVNMKNQQQQQQQQAKAPNTYSRINNSSSSGLAVNTNSNLLAMITSGNKSIPSTPSFSPIAPKPPASSSITISTVTMPSSTTSPSPASKPDPSSLSISEVPAAGITTLTNGMVTADEDDEMDVEVVPPPPKPPSPDVVDLSDDEESGETEQEILPEEPDCVNHPIDPPVVPLFVRETLLPKPRLIVRMGKSRDNKMAVILRMESAVDATKCQGLLQYRIFSYFQNMTEPVADRRWKQLTCIKVKCGKICECTLTQLVVNARYHFVVCLVNGDYRSKFSNCATIKFV